MRKAGDDRADANVIAWASTVDAGQLFISAITVMELEIGILRISRRDGAQGKLLRTWMDSHVLPEFAQRTLPIDTAVALRCARLHVPDPRSERDALIAATALTHAMAVVTRNTEDFAPSGVALINPWQREVI